MFNNPKRKVTDGDIDNLLKILLGDVGSVAEELAKQPFDLHIWQEEDRPGMRAEITGNTLSMGNALVNLLMQSKSFADIFTTVMDRYKHIMTCECESCANIRSKFNRKLGQL